ncbi:MAG: hypothetical protein ACE37F_06700 [Nannocystaceae bacterium]|nr:hypothetical protein [bacterium]
MLEHDHASAERLAEYLRGDLDAAAASLVEEHISSCLVCARALREEAQLEMLLYEALDTADEAAGFDVVAEPLAPVASRSRRALWQRFVATVANTAAAAAALVLVVSPGQPLGASGSQSVSMDASGNTVTAAAFVNDDLCFPTVVPDPADEDCDDPVVAVTDPDDYLSPFDSDLGVSNVVAVRGTALNACLVEDLACEPS